jgi:glycosyltransferase involved in cell wall biosynthesis
MKRVLHVINQLGPGGAETLLSDLAAAGPAHGFTMELASLFAPIDWYADALRERGVPVHVLGYRLNGVVRPLANLIRLIRRERPDVVHAHLPQAELLCAAARPLFPRTAFVTTLHSVQNGPMHGAWRPIRITALSAFDRHIACGEVVREAHLAWAPRFAARTVVIRNGAAAPASEGVALPPEAARPFLLFLGNLKPAKAADVLVEAVALAPAAWPVLVVGTALKGGPEAEQLAARVRALGLEDRIHFLGRQPRELAMALLARAGAMLLPSRWEGMPMTVIEALQVGTPVVATPVGEVPYMVRDGVEGLLIPIGDAPALAAAMTRVSTDPELRARLAEGARARGPMFGIEACASSYGDLYRELVG